MKRYLALALLTLVAAGCDAITSHTATVARAGEHELTVDETVDLLATSTEIPAEEDVVRSVVEVWLDYTLLASLAVEDSTLAGLDFESLLQPYVERQTFSRLRNEVMTADTVISDEELRALFETEAPGLRIRARHILLTSPDGATESQRDSVRALAQELRERAASGEDFSELARQYSDDQGTAQQNGDLGWFERGSMVQPFEEAAFALEVGEVSDVVETPFGLHIIKLDDRETPTVDEVDDDLRRQAVNQRQQESLNQYVEGLREGRSFEVQDGAQEIARELAADASRPIRDRAASRELVTWEGGTLTAGEVARLFQGMPPRQRTQYTSLGDEEMAELLRDVATNELVLADAQDREITVPQEEQDSVRRLIRDQVVSMARDAGLIGSLQEGETEAEAVDRRVRSLLTGTLSGQREFLPLGALSGALREQGDWQIQDQGIATAVQRLAERRESGTETPEPGPDSEPEPTVEDPDTTG